MTNVNHTAELNELIDHNLRKLDEEAARLRAAQVALSGPATPRENSTATTAKLPRAKTRAPVTLSTLATTLNTDTTTLRGFLRKLGVGVGKGQRYEWQSMVDPEVLQIVRAWETTVGRAPHQPSGVVRSVRNRHNRRRK